MNPEILKQRIDLLFKQLESCNICPHNCKINRLKNELGLCRIGKYAKVASFSPHHGEERVLSGWKGSGTVFFSCCNLKCQFCQNYDISQLDYGHEIKEEELAQIMLKLQNLGCHNINLVTPTHVIPQIIKALLIAFEKGLKIPIVYNCGGYEKVETLKHLEGIIDIYMPDMKYGDSEIGFRFSKIKNYAEINQSAVYEMHRQVGDLVINKNGIAEKGLLIRHLVLPENLSNSEIIFDYLSNKISKATYINIMDQYYPSYNAKKYPEICRRITNSEYQNALILAKNKGLYRLAD